MDLQPRILRLKDAPAYLGMDKNRFNTEVRPYLTEIPIGTQGIAFDRLDLDHWIEAYKSRNGRPGRAMKGDSTWRGKCRQDSLKEGKFGISTKTSVEKELDNQLERILSKKRSGS